jgi:putative transcriptional regulator
MHLQNRVRELRTSRNLTQEQLGALARVTRQTIIAIEKSKFVPSVKLALDIAVVLNVTIGELFWLEDTKEN